MPVSIGRNGADDPEFMTPAQIASILRISPMTVNRLIHSGELEAHRFGRNFKVRRAVLEKYIRDTIVHKEDEND